MSFSKRIRAAMLAAGIETAEQLAKRCEVERSVAEGWLRLEDATLPGVELVRVARRLRVRVQWLTEGAVPMRLPPDFERVILILDGLAPAQMKRWLKDGLKMTGRSE